PADRVRILSKLCQNGLRLHNGELYDRIQQRLILGECVQSQTHSCPEANVVGMTKSVLAERLVASRLAMQLPFFLHVSNVSSSFRKAIKFYGILYRVKNVLRQRGGGASGPGAAPEPLATLQSLVNRDAASVEELQTRVNQLTEEIPAAKT
ncbi:hypothetical protein T265_15698, partial [Opisthorchis viverrini]